MDSAKFWDSLELRVVDGGYELLKDFTYHSNLMQRPITAPKGFITDLASIPRVARWMFTGHGKSREPAVIHDWLYRNFHQPRKEADQVFREALKVAGMGTIARNIMYAAVRTGGWTAY